MEHSSGRPATQIEIEAMTAIANLQDENRELRLTIRQLKAEQSKICDACFTSSWQPCPPLTPNCIPDNIGGWMVCGHCRLVAEYEKMQVGNKELKTALDSVIAQGGNLSDEALEVNGINDGRSRLIMYLNSRDVALKVLGFSNIKEWWEDK